MAEVMIMIFIWVRAITMTHNRVKRIKAGLQSIVKTGCISIVLTVPGTSNPKDYFETPVLVDKKRPLNRALKRGEFTFTDNCALNDSSLKYVDYGSLNGCSEGWIQRTWTIEDKCGNKVSASQKVIVKHRSDFEVIFPKDTIITCAPQASGLNPTDTSDLGAGKPKIFDDECEQIGLNYKDEIFNVEDSACYKIIRTWTLIDWCIYDPNQHHRSPDIIVDDRFRANNTNRSCVYRYLKDNNDGYMQYVQIIKVIDEIAPVITCSDQTICIETGCTATVNIPLVATDNCSDDIEFRVNITRPDNSHDIRVGVKSISGPFAAGKYSIQIIARDHCSNEDTCTMKLTINDCKKPTPYCINGLATVVMPSTGSIEIWAKDFDRGSADNCTDASKLKFSFSKNVADANRLLKCSDIRNGREETITITMWVTDESGNQDFCTTYILLQDNGSTGLPGGACKDTAIAAATITGRLLTENKEGVEFATIELKENSTLFNTQEFKTKSDGTYAFSNVPMIGNQSLSTVRDDNPMNGISTLDLVLIQKHILGTEKLNSPYKVIAADIDNDNDVSVVDLIELRKLILGLYDKLPNNTSWKFVPKTHSFVDPLNPWDYPQGRTPCMICRRIWFEIS
jgi:hypothetical protein